MEYRNLTESEIAALQTQGCETEDWRKVLVADPFDSSRVRRVRFSGEVRVGILSGTVTLTGGAMRACGLYDSSVHNCELGNDVHLSGVRNLASYRVGDGTVIENVGCLVVDGESAFGNGTRIEALNEGGGRTLPIYDRLTAQVAYLLVLYRHRPALVEKLDALIGQYVGSRRSDRGTIGAGCRIQDCQSLVNLDIGPSATIVGALRLQDGTIGSCPEDPVHIGEGVFAKHFIILSGSRVEESAILSSCFVGQGVRIGEQFSAKNSAFFANAEGFHGEACSVFAGPYTVTHHKSTLLIAGLFSFYNAGSGANQSNHMYKLGPVHQGILERGSKTGSFSYLRWPCHVGPFSVVINKHSGNFDTSDLPFSFVDTEGGDSFVTPAMNLFTVGTRRDSAKWPARDRRKAPQKLDLVDFELFNPYIVGKIVRGVASLRDLYEKTPREREDVSYRGIKIKRLMLRTACKYYEMAVKIYLGEKVLSRLDGVAEKGDWSEVVSRLQPDGSEGTCDWVDLAGMFAPQDSVDSTIGEIENGAITSVADLASRLEAMHRDRPRLEWNWCARLLEHRLGNKVSAMTADQVKGILEDWKTNAVKLNRMILQDACKEFDEVSRIGFGIDGDNRTRDEDFTAVRGNFENNSFVKELERDNADIEKRAEKAVALIDNRFS